MGENPVLSDPNIAHAEHWVRGLEFLAVQDLFLTETARWADVVLPGSSFAEKEGTVINTDRHIQLMEAAQPVPGDARLDLDILIDLSNRMGLPSPYTGPSDVMDELARVTPIWKGVNYDRLRELRSLQYPVHQSPIRAPRSCSPMASPRQTGGHVCGRGIPAAQRTARAKSIPTCSTPVARCITGIPAR